MAKRLDKQRQEKLEPERIKTTKAAIENVGINITYQDKTDIRFLYKGHEVRFFPYSGWHTGKSIQDGRGFKHLLNQIKNG